MPNDIELDLDLSQFTELVTSQGAILYCRIVPPFAQAAVRRRMPAPPLPRVEVKSASGTNVETHIALPGTPEHDAYLKAKAEHTAELGMALQRFTVHYGIVAWRLAPGEPVQVDPPEDWVLPQALVDYDVAVLAGPERRAQYILYVLILTDEDLDLVEATLLPTEEVGREEVAAALAPFASTMADNLLSMESLLSQEKGPEAG